MFPSHGMNFDCVNQSWPPTVDFPRHSYAEGNLCRGNDLSKAEAFREGLTFLVSEKNVFGTILFSPFSSCLEHRYGIISLDILLP